MTDVLEPGLTSHSILLIKEEDLATNWGADLPVLASPVLVGLIEAACADTVKDLLPEGHITVGVGFDLLHLAPTPKGDVAQTTVTLECINVKQLLFSVEVRDGNGLICSGSHLRAVVDQSRFMKKVRLRTDSLVQLEDLAEQV